MDPKIRSPVEIEIKNRIKLAVAAWAYEKHNDSFLSDDEFDKLALSIQKDMKTGNRKLDNFFKKHFLPDTGMWVNKHPDRPRLEWLYQNYYKENAN